MNNSVVKRRAVERENEAQPAAVALATALYSNS